MRPPVATCPVLNTFSLITAHGARLPAFREQSLLSLEMGLGMHRGPDCGPTEQLSRVRGDKSKAPDREQLASVSDSTDPTPARRWDSCLPPFWMGMAVCH